MKQLITPQLRRRMHFVMYGVLVGAIILVCAQLVHIHGLSSKVAQLETQIAQNDLKTAVYERSLCTTPKLEAREAKTVRYTITSAGYERSYLVHAPRHYDPSIRYPVILGFDGTEGSASRIESYAGINELPVIAVYPEALPGKYGFTAWQGASYAAGGTRDMQFVKDLLDTLPSQYCVDSSKVFAVGMSNGGGFAVLAVCELSSQIRAVASISGAYYTDCAKSGKKTPSLMILHSKTDKQVPFLGERFRKLPDIPRWVERKASARVCSDGAQRTAPDGTVYYSWFNCKDESLLRFVAVNSQEHGWLQISNDSTEASNTALSIWEFFKETIYS